MMNFKEATDFSTNYWPLTDTSIWVKSGDVSIVKTLEKIKRKIPTKFMIGLDGIYIGDFPHLEERGLDAIYKEFVIYASGEQESEEDLLSDIIHEIAHHVESQGSNSDTIFLDQDLQDEFLRKRQEFIRLLDKHEVPIPYREELLSLKYNEEVDTWLYEELTYDFLNVLTSNIFISPYACTSFQEYWANGFEHYFMGNLKRLKNISPVLYRKIEEITYEE